MKYILLCTLILFVSLSAVAQREHLLSGYISDKQTKERLPGTYIQIHNLQKGTATDLNGFYSLMVPEDSIHIIVTSTGYHTFHVKLYPLQNRELNIELEMKEDKLEEDVIEANNYSEQVNRTQMSISTVSSKEARLLPAIFGEVDLMKVLQLKPEKQSVHGARVSLVPLFMQASRFYPKSNIYNWQIYHN